MRFQQLALPALAAATSLAIAGAGRAVDGVIEINDAKALAGDVTGTGGDAPGYPVTLDISGSYVLTGNLTPAALTAISVTAASDVEIDLNGFTLVGSGGADGIAAAGTTRLTVRGGGVTGFGGAGILGSSQLTVLETRISGNGGGGISTASNCVLVENVIEANAGVGIEAVECKIENNVIKSNDGSGIEGFANVIVHNVVNANGFALGGGGMLVGGSTIQENTVLGNAFFGISDTPGMPPAPVPAPPGVLFPGAPSPGPRNTILKNAIDGSPLGFGVYTNSTALVTDNTVGNNFLDGIVCGIACTIRGNEVDSNNTSATSNGGVTAGPGSTVNDNSISFNTGIGLVIAPTAGYMNNTFDANTVGDTTTAFPFPGPAHPSSGFLNLCSGAPGPAATCP